MPRSQKLKVYRTPIGFHDAYVAAANQKAALEAWGSDANLFARGIAEIVTDDELAREPLANPGQVIRRLRGTTEEQIAALPKSEPVMRSLQPGKPSKASKPQAKSRPGKPKPRPDRKPVDEAERAIEATQARFEETLRELKNRQAALDRERRALEREHEGAILRLQKKLDRARVAYDRAMERWRG